MRRHVHQVSCTRNQRLQTLRAWQRTLRVRRSLQRMNVIVIRTGMHRITRQHRFQNSYDFFGMLAGLPILGPKFPWIEIHQTFRIHRRGIEIFRILAREGPHAHRVNICQFLVVGLCFARIPQHQCCDIVLFDPRRTLSQFGGLLNRLKRDFLPSCVHIRVVVWPNRHRNSPKRHGRLRVELRSFLERACRFFMIESV